jgi:hypothetical protein
MTIIITPTTTIPGRVAEAELHFTEGVLAGLKLIGFSVWQRRDTFDYSVTFPARQYSVNGERRSFAVLRPIQDYDATTTLKQAIIEATKAYMASGTPPHTDEGVF